MKKEPISALEDYGTLFNKIKKALHDLSNQGYLVQKVIINVNEPIKFEIIPTVSWVERKNVRKIS